MAIFIPKLEQCPGIPHMKKFFPLAKVIWSFPEVKVVPEGLHALKLGSLTATTVCAPLGYLNTSVSPALKLFPFGHELTPNPQPPASPTLNVAALVAGSKRHKKFNNRTRAIVFDMTILVKMWGEGRGIDYCCYTFFGWLILIMVFNLYL